MSDYDELIQQPAALEDQTMEQQVIEKKTFLDYFSLAVSTFGVGYLPLAPGTWGSIVGVAIYLFLAWIEKGVVSDYALRNWTVTQIAAWLQVFNLVVFLLFCLAGIRAASRAGKIFQKKDPQKVVVDEVIGQLIVFLFVPFTFSWKMILAGFLLFRVFDIWKPYPINSLENLPGGIGICADDILAGVYGGVCLSLIYAISLTI